MLSLLACSSNRTTVERVGNLVVEATNAKGEGSKSLGEQSLQLELTRPNDNLAWVRGRYLFERYSSEKTSINPNELKGTIGKKEHYLCQVKRVPNKEVVDYTISCNGKNMVQADHLARNIARFMEAGVLSDMAQFYL